MQWFGCECLGAGRAVPTACMPGTEPRAGLQSISIPDERDPKQIRMLTYPTGQLMRLTAQYAKMVSGTEKQMSANDV